MFCASIDNSQQTIHNKQLTILIIVSNTIRKKKIKVFKIHLFHTGLVNGQGERHPQKDENNVTAYTPPEVFNVKHGKSYRFRMIGATTTCQFQVSVDNHSLAVIATDGKPLKPVTVQSIVIYPGRFVYFVGIFANLRQIKIN